MISETYKNTRLCFPTLIFGTELKDVDEKVKKEKIQTLLANYCK